MTERWITREGRVVERHGAPVVRFGADCAGPGPCACALAAGGEHHVSLASLGLGDTAASGHRVTVAVPARALTRVAVVLFGLPLVALLAGAWAGAALAVGATTDAAAALVGLVALALTLLLVTRSSGALMRTLKVEARLQRTN